MASESSIVRFWAGNRVAGPGRTVDVARGCGHGVSAMSSGEPTGECSGLAMRMRLLGILIEKSMNRLRPAEGRTPPSRPSLSKSIGLLRRSPGAGRAGASPRGSLVVNIGGRTGSGLKGVEPG